MQTIRASIILYEQFISKKLQMKKLQMYFKQDTTQSYYSARRPATQEFIDDAIVRADLRQHTPGTCIGLIDSER